MVAEKVTEQELTIEPVVYVTPDHAPAGHVPPTVLDRVYPAFAVTANDCVDPERTRCAEEGDMDTCPSPLGVTIYAGRPPPTELPLYTIGVVVGFSDFICAFIKFLVASKKLPVPRVNPSGCRMSGAKCSCKRTSAVRVF
jgi:hypothetical protein